MHSYAVLPSSTPIASTVALTGARHPTHPAHPSPPADGKLLALVIFGAVLFLGRKHS